MAIAANSSHQSTRRSKNYRYNLASFGLVAQLVEQRIENPRVGGSIPPQATKSSPKSASHHRLAFLFLVALIRVPA